MSKKPKKRLSLKVLLFTFALSLLPVGVFFTSARMASKWDMRGDYVFEAKCVAPCQDVLTSNIKITSHDFQTGNYIGTSSLVNSTATATMFGSVKGTKFTISIKVDPGLGNIEFNGEGKISRDGILSGRYGDGQRTFNFVAVSGKAKKVNKEDIDCEKRKQGFGRKSCEPTQSEDD